MVFASFLPAYHACQQAGRAESTSFFPIPTYFIITILHYYNISLFHYLNISLFPIYFHLFSTLIFNLSSSQIKNPYTLTRKILIHYIFRRLWLMWTFITKRTFRLSSTINTLCKFRWRICQVESRIIPFRFLRTIHLIHSGISQTIRTFTLLIRIIPQMMYLTEKIP